MVDVQRTAQLAYAAAAAAVKSERVCWSGHKPAIRRTQAAGQHEVGWLQGLSHGCSYRGREIAILLRLRCQATTAGRDITASQPSERIAFSDDCLGTLSPNKLPQLRQRRARTGIAPQYTSTGSVAFRALTLGERRHICLLTVAVRN